MSEKVSLFLLFFPVFLFSLSFHECAHAWVANRLGDSTARMMGRMTLNPLPHMDPIGTFFLPLLVFLMPVAVIPIGGWGRPVPVNPLNLRGGRRGGLWVAAAGPLSNLLLAGLFSLIFRGLAGAHFNPPWSEPLYGLLEVGVFLNLGLAFFNLIPLHPLDGGKVMEGILPLRYLDSYERVARYGMLIIIAAFYLGLTRLIRVPVDFFARVLLP